MERERERVKNRLKGKWRKSESQIFSQRERERSRTRERERERCVEMKRVCEREKEIFVQWKEREGGRGKFLPFKMNPKREQRDMKLEQMVSVDSVDVCKGLVKHKQKDVKKVGSRNIEINSMTQIIASNRIVSKPK